MKKWLFLFLLLIPTQLGKHFWPEWSYVLGIRSDYLSPTLYLVDLIWIGLFLITNYELRITNFRYKFSSFIFLLFVGVNIYLAENHWVAGYRWLRIFQLIWTIWYLGIRRKEILNYLKLIIPVWIIFESFLGVAQMFNSGSLNGVFYFLGERSFNFNTIGIAQISVLGEGFIRAYGTFSHPNSLGGFLLVGMILWWGYKSLGKNIFQKTCWWVVTWSGVLGIIITGSRVVIVLSILYLVFSMRRKIKWGGILIVLGLVLITIGVLGNKDILGGWDKEGLNKRKELNLAAVSIVKSSPLFGVGMGNFLVKLPEYQENNGIRWLQPVHNIPLLLLSEMGVIGIFLLIKIFKISDIRSQILGNKILWLVWGVILVTGLFDHYWLTLPQNWWMVGIVISLSSSKPLRPAGTSP